MAAIVQAQANLILNATVAGTAAQATTGVKVRLGTTVGTATSAMSELSGTGYTTGGTATSWNAASSGSMTNSTALSWTNSSGSSWTIEGGEIWDEAGTPLRWWFWAWTGQPITIANGNTFSVASGGITITLT